MHVDWTNHRLDKCPAWARQLAAREAAQHGIDSPRLRFVPPCPEKPDGGQYYPEARGILVVESGNEAFDRGVLCHELTHLILTEAFPSVRHVGAHDIVFYRYVEKVYQANGVSLALARRVEGLKAVGYPAEWDRRSKW